MNRWKSIGTAALIAVAAVACNRGANNSSKTASTTGTTNVGENAQTTLQGCLKPGDQAGNYLLTVASNDNTSARPAGTSGTSATAGSAANSTASESAEGNRTYRVIANNVPDANANVGARVTVVGVIDTTMTSTPRNASGTTSSTGTTGTSGSATPGTAASAGGAPAAGNTSGQIAAGDMQTIRATTITKTGEGCQ